MTYHAMLTASTARAGLIPLKASGSGRSGAGQDHFLSIFPPLTDADSAPILMVPSTKKGGDPVSYTKRCHLAGIAR
jgi:hypothetical protein